MSAMDHLLGLLASQQDVLSRLQELCREERACLLNSQLDRLDDITQEQRTLLTSQAHLSTRIIQTLDRAGIELGLTGRMSLARVAENAQGPVTERVREFYSDISAMADELQREGRVNWYLAQQALKYVDFTLKLVGRAKEGPLPYTPHAQAGSMRSTQLLMDSCA